MSIDALLQAAVIYAVPLWLAGLGELVVERAGMLNIGIEGMMLSGALAAWLVTMITGSPWLGLLAALLVGLLLAGLLALVTLVFDADQVVAGTAINLLAVGVTGAGFKLAVDAGVTTRTASFFSPWQVAGQLTFLNQFGLCYATLLLAILLAILLRRTRWGVELTALGEYPDAAVAAGIAVRRRRFFCLLFGGATAGLAGSYLSIMFTREFGIQMTAGRGFLALAMVIFGLWRPLPLLAGGLFFGLVYAGATFLEVRPGSGWSIPPQLLQMSPYVLSLVALAGFMGRTRPPAALGQPLPRE